MNVPKRVFSNIFGTLKLVSYFSLLYFKFLENDIPKLPKALPPKLKMRPLVVERVSFNILESLELVQIFN